MSVQKDPNAYYDPLESDDLKTVITIAMYVENTVQLSVFSARLYSLDSVFERCGGRIEMNKTL